MGDESSMREARGKEGRKKKKAGRTDAKPRAHSRFEPHRGRQYIAPVVISDLSLAVQMLAFILLLVCYLTGVTIVVDLSFYT